MQFTIEMTYDPKAMTSMARAMRKTMRRKSNRRTHILGWLIVALALLLNWGKALSVQTVVTGLAGLLVFVTLIWEDRINGYLAWKKALPGTEKSSTVFGEEGYQSETEIGTTQWHYEKIQMIAETEKYFVFLFNKSHGQIYEKRKLSGGSTEEFRSFLQEKTGLEIQKVK